jgi:AcrR family transcriptional regulator
MAKKRKLMTAAGVAGASILPPESSKTLFEFRVLDEKSPHNQGRRGILHPFTSDLESFPEYGQEWVRAVSYRAQSVQRATKTKAVIMARVGRPVAMAAEERRELVFEHAERLFCDKGYSGVTMTEIAKATAMSKKTLYVMFADKEELLRELVSSSYLWDAGASQAVAPDPVEEVRQRLRIISKHVLSPRHINLCRLALGESISKNGIADTFLELGIHQSRASLVEAIDRIPDKRRRVVLSSNLIAGMLFGATCSVNLMTAMLTGKNPVMQKIAESIDVVINAVFVLDEAAIRAD